MAIGANAKSQTPLLVPERAAWRGTRLGSILRANSSIRLATLATRSSDTEAGSWSPTFKYRDTYAALWPFRPKRVVTMKAPASASISTAQ